MAVASLRIDGIRCDGCVRALEATLRGVPGVRRVEVSLDPAAARVDFDEAMTAPTALADVVREEGYGANPLAG